MPTPGNFTAGTQDQIDALDTLTGFENAAGDATVKGTILMLLLSMLRPAQLDSVATNLITAAAKFVVDDAGIVGGRANRYLTIAQMVELMSQRTGQVVKVQPFAKVGATAGWSVGGGAVNTGKVATLPAGQAGATLVLAIQGLKLGQIITRVTLNGSMQSAGNAASLTWDLRRLTSAAAGAGDASITTLAAPVAVVANTKVDVANGSRLLPVPYTVVADDSLYLLVTATTAAATTQEIDSLDVTVTEV